MPKEAPFDVWDGEELGTTDEVETDAAEEVAMHVDPDSEPSTEGPPHWSELTDDDEVDVGPPVRYFDDEQPERARQRAAGDEREPDLEELLERQHYAFRRKG